MVNFTFVENGILNDVERIIFARLLSAALRLEDIKGDVIVVACELRVIACYLPWAAIPHIKS